MDCDQTWWAWLDKRCERDHQAKVGRRSQPYTYSNLGSHYKLLNIVCHQILFHLRPTTASQLFHYCSACAGPAVWVRLICYLKLCLDFNVTSRISVSDGHLCDSTMLHSALCSLVYGMEVSPGSQNSTGLEECHIRTMTWMEIKMSYLVIVVLSLL